MRSNGLSNAIRSSRWRLDTLTFMNRCLRPDNALFYSIGYGTGYLRLSGLSFRHECESDLAGRPAHGPAFCSGHRLRRSSKPRRSGNSAVNISCPLSHVINLKSEVSYPLHFRLWTPSIAFFCVN
jgi:hypothetical protein